MQRWHRLWKLSRSNLSRSVFLCGVIPQTCLRVCYGEAGGPGPEGDLPVLHPEGGHLKLNWFPQDTDSKVFEQQTYWRHFEINTFKVVSETRWIKGWSWNEADAPGQLPGNSGSRMALYHCPELEQRDSASMPLHPSHWEGGSCFWGRAVTLGKQLLLAEENPGQGLNYSQ